MNAGRATWKGENRANLISSLLPRHILCCVRLLQTRYCLCLLHLLARGHQRPADKIEKAEILFRAGKRCRRQKFNVKGAGKQHIFISGVAFFIKRDVILMTSAAANVSK